VVECEGAELQLEGPGRNRDVHQPADGLGVGHLGGGPQVQRPKASAHLPLAGFTAWVSAFELTIKFNGVAAVAAVALPRATEPTTTKPTTNERAWRSESVRRIKASPP